MRVLLAAKYLHYPQGGGGLERNTHELCLRLVRRGITPAVMCDLELDGSLLERKNRLKRLLRPSRRFPVDRALGYEVYRGWSNEDGAQEVVSRFKPDIVIAQSAQPAPLLEFFTGLGIPRMAYFHEVGHIDQVNALSEMADVGLLANSDFTASKMAERAACQPIVIRPLIDRSHYVTKTTPKNVLFINASVSKGIVIGLQLAERRPDVQFDFVQYWNPTPMDREFLENPAHKMKNITLHNPTNDLRRLYGMARTLLVPSQCDEAWGRVATEAQINGIPVLASNRGGLAESVGPGGILVAHDAPIEAWVEAFGRLWDDEAEHTRFAAAALQHSNRADIQPENIVTLFIDTIKNFIHNRSPASAR